MVKLVRFIAIAGLAIFLTACPETVIVRDVAVSITNNSKEDIIWLFRLETSGDINAIFKNPWGEEYDFSTIHKGCTFVDKWSSDNIKYYLDRGWIKYYLFNYDSIKSISWQRICDERIILKEVRFDTWEDFEKCNFEITYP